MRSLKTGLMTMAAAVCLAAAAPHAAQAQGVYWQPPAVSAQVYPGGVYTQPNYVPPYTYNNGYNYGYNNNGYNYNDNGYHDNCQRHREHQRWQRAHHREIERRHEDHWDRR